MKQNKLDLMKEPAEGTIEAGNAIYRVFVQDNPDLPVGDYTAQTGPNHPIGPGRNLLFGSGSPGTTFNTFRSYTTMTDYTVDSFSVTQPPFVKVDIRQFAETVPLGNTGVRTTYVLPGPPVTPDSLTIVQDVNVIGSTFENSYIEVRVQIENRNNVDTRIGIRYLWDPIIGSDDGPTFQTLNPISPLITNETLFDMPSFESYQLADNDNNPNPPTYIIFGSAGGPANIRIGPTPTRIQYASWPASRVTAFDYTVNPDRNVSSPPNNDCAVLYYWGHNLDTAITLQANGGAFTVAAALFATKPGVVPPFLNNHICIKANRIFDVCRLNTSQTEVINIPELQQGVLLGCEIKKAECFVCNINRTENGVDSVQIQLNFNIAFFIKSRGTVVHVIRPLNYITFGNLTVPENTTVSCEIQNPVCNSRQLDNGQVEVIINAPVQLESIGTQSIVVPFVANCPVGLCPAVPTVSPDAAENGKHDSSNGGSEETASGSGKDKA